MDIKVGFITTESSETMLNQARISGASFVINKPFKDEDLLREVQAALASCREAAKGPAPALESAEALNRCALESKYLCTQCSDATLDPSAQPPSNGAKLFSWNSCYDNNDNAATGNSYDGCLEQWGSYAASCLKLSGRAYAPGKRCKNICNTTTCPKGCFKKYGAGNSGTLLASWYQCQ